MCMAEPGPAAPARDWWPATSPTWSPRCWRNCALRRGPARPRVLATQRAATMAERWRPAWADIDLDALRHNASVLSRLARPALLCAGVKADGDGHGALPAARAALDGGAAWLAVALVEEGVTLREAGVDAPILLLSE